MMSAKNESSRTRPQVMPKRTATHITGEQAVLAFRQLLPKEWILREVSTDYGIDCEIEIVNADGLVTGAIVFAQLKGTVSENAAKQVIVQVKSSTVRYWVSLPIPVIIVRVFGTPAHVYWLDVRRHLQDTDRLDSVFTTRSTTLSFNFSYAPSLPSSSNNVADLALEHQAAVRSMRDEDDARLAGEFVGYHILIHVFDGDVDKWIQWLRDKGSDDQIIHDYPFAVWVRSPLKEDSQLLDRVKGMVSRTQPNGQEIDEDNNGERENTQVHDESTTG
jgi:hypothetical protein